MTTWRRNIFVAALAAVLLPMRALALDWDQTSSTVAPKPGADAVLATFTYVNRGKALVHITGVETTCGCTEATVSLNEVPPGASGNVAVLFSVGDRTGRQVREILVHTDDAREPTKLTMTVELPAPAPRRAK